MGSKLDTKIASVTLIAAGSIYFYWLLGALNWDEPYFASFFLGVNIITGLWTLMCAINYFSYTIPQFKILDGEVVPNIGVIIPTWSEPVEMVKRTAQSVLEQNYPNKNIWLMITDDSANEGMKNLVYELQALYPEAHLIYNIPPAKDSAEREGEGKSGNLNSALKYFLENENIKYIETRDADDLVWDQDFLRICLAHLEEKPLLAYVQTVKEVISSPGDPFGNLETFFYRCLMTSKNAANSVFPCGSGLVWRKIALIDIGKFPTWNLVEDYQSGIEAMRRGWKSLMVPIVGAMGQISPEDIPNLYKQRGTWAMDAIRYLFWGDKSGLSLRQKLHFVENGINYMLSPIAMVYALIIAYSLIIDTSPIDAPVLEYLVYTFPYFFALLILVYVHAMNSGVSAFTFVRTMQTYYGLGPVYLKSFFLALFYGPNRKPRYVVTRKEHMHSLYITNVLPQILIVSTLIGSIIWNAYEKKTFNILYIPNYFWAVFCIILFTQTIKNSWFKYSLLKDLMLLWQRFYSRVTFQGSYARARV